MSHGHLHTHQVSVVVPVYRAEKTLESLVGELVELHVPRTTPAGFSWRVSEVILVHDHGPDRSADVIRALAEEHEDVGAVWLSRNFGQHAATLAGMASSGSEWVATIDEDGQHDPREIGLLLDAAMRLATPLVYGTPANTPPHGIFRNNASRGAKAIIALVSGDPHATKYQSFRLMTGEIARSVAAYAGPGVYLDVALRWIAPEPTTADIKLRGTEVRSSGYTLRKLIAHFWRLVLTSGTRGLRLVSGLGAILAALGVVVAITLAFQRLLDGSVPEGWTSTIVVLLIASGAILFSLGVIAEYLGVAVNMAMGRPRYLIVSDPAQGPLGRHRTER